MRTIIDYETRSRADLETCGAIEYAKHESTSIFCVGYKIDKGPVKLWIPELSPLPKDLWLAFDRATLVAHNASFERAITRYTLPRYLPNGRALAIQSLWPDRWVCTAAKAAASSLPRSLEGAALALDLPTKKDMEGSKLTKKYSKPRKPTKNNPDEWWYDSDGLNKIYEYCKTDVQVEYELDRALPDLTPHEQKIWELDQKINDRGVLIDIPTVKKILSLIKIETENINKRIYDLSNGVIDKPTKRAQILDWVNARGAKIKNLQAATIRDRLLDKDISSEVRLMLEYRQDGSKTSTAKYNSMIHSVGDDNRARELLLYHGAIPTGRWSGRRLQPQNMKRSHIDSKNVDRIIDYIKRKR